MNDLGKYKCVITAIVLAVMTVGFCQSTFASPIVLDQNQESSDGGSAFFNFVSLAQTFTPAVGGQLDHVDLLICDSFGEPTYPATISIVETVGGAPTGALLGQVDVLGFIADTDYDTDGDGIPDLRIGWNSIDFSTEAIFLNVGTKYGIVLANDDPNKDAAPTDALRVQWDGDVYPAGMLWEWTAASGSWEPAVFDDFSEPGMADGAFKTYMVIPEPASLALSALMLLSLFCKKRPPSF